MCAIPAMAEPCSTTEYACARGAGLVQAVSRQARVVIRTVRFVALHAAGRCGAELSLFPLRLATGL